MTQIGGCTTVVGSGAEVSRQESPLPLPCSVSVVVELPEKLSQCLIPVHFGRGNGHAVAVKTEGKVEVVRCCRSAA